MTLVLLMVIEIPLTGCAGSSTSTSTKMRQRWYSYEYRLANAPAWDSLSFSNKLFDARFSIDETSLGIKIVNKAVRSIYPDYSRAMIGIGGRYVPAAISADGRQYTAASLIIPRGGCIETRLVPLYALGDHKTGSFFPATDNGDIRIRQQILKQIGKSLTLMLPVSVNGKDEEYEFVFKVKKIRSSPMRKTQPRVDGKETASAGHSVLPLLLVTGGVAGVVFLLSTQRDKPSN